MRGQYDDIIDLPHHVSKNRKQMTLEERAGQFAPFAALSGYQDEINERAKMPERRERGEIFYYDDSETFFDLDLDADPGTAEDDKKPVRR